MATEATTPTPSAPPVSPFRKHRGLPHPLQRRLRWLGYLGPGVITGAADDDPSGVGTYSQAGASFGTGQLWLAFYMLPMLIAVQEMCGRIGLITGKGVAAVIREHYNRPLLLTTVVLVLIANTINIGADLGAMAATTQLLVPSLPFLVLLALIGLIILLLEVFVPYRHYAIILKLFTLSLLAYIATGIIIGPKWGTLLLSSIIPHIQLTSAFLALIVGVLGTTISPYLFFWQASEEVEEIQEHHRQIRQRDPLRQRLALHLQVRRLRMDTYIGMVASEITTWFIIVTTGSILYTHGITNITTPDQAAAALQPLVHSFPNAGEWAKAIFALGILGVGFLAVPVLAGSAAYGVAEVFGWTEGLGKSAGQARGFYAVIAAATLVGIGLNLLHINPISALVYTAVINGVVAVPLLAIILLVANNQTIMREFTNNRLSNVVSVITTVLMGVAAVGMIVSFFWH